MGKIRPVFGRLANYFLITMSSDFGGASPNRAKVPWSSN